MDDRLFRSVDDRMLAGVAGGVAERLGADPSLIRIVWALLVVLTGGIALVVYIVMAIVVPDDPGLGPDALTPSTPAPTGPLNEDAPTAAFVAEPRARRRTRPGHRDDDRGPLIGGLILILIGAFFLFRELVPAIDLGSWWPLILVGIGVILVVVSITPGRRSD